MTYRAADFFSYDASHRLADFFDSLERVWDGVEALPGYIDRIIQPRIDGVVEDGAWAEPGAVELHKGAVIERGAVVRGPAIIGEGTVIRIGAALRGHTYIGADCSVGCNVELRQMMMLRGSKITHQNCVFTSLLGNNVWIGGHTSTGNVLLSRKPIEIRVVENGERKSYPTGMSKLGAVIGDDSSIGGMSSINPGALVGRNCMVHSHCAVSGHLPDGALLKLAGAPFETVLAEHR